MPIEIQAIAAPASHPEEIELSGVRFDGTIVDPGVRLDYAIGRHGSQDFRLPLQFGSASTSDPRRDVTQARAVFNIPMQPAARQLDPSDVSIESATGSFIPGYAFSFPDKDLTGSIEGTNIRFVRSRIGSIAP